VELGHWGFGELYDACSRDALIFARAVLGPPEPWEKQAEILRAVSEHDRVVVRSGHGVGKTWASARCVLWFLFCHRGAIVLTTAPTWRQVEKVLWREILSQHRRSRCPLGGRRLKTQLVLEEDWFALGLSTDEPERFQGFHAEHLMVVMDEAPGIGPEIWEAVESVASSSRSKVLAIGNPIEPAGPFYEAFRSPHWRKIHISCLESPGVRGVWEPVSGGGGVLVPPGAVVPGGLVSREWVEARRAEWGEESPLYQSRVLGEFPETPEDALIPLGWLERAKLRPHERRGELVLGVDVARFGGDESVLCVRDFNGVVRLSGYRKHDTMFLVGKIIELVRGYGIAPENIKVDCVGLGAGVVDRLREQGLAVQEVNFGAPSASPERFANLRAECYWAVREALKPEGGFSLPDDERLVADLAVQRLRYTSRGQIMLVGKDDLRREIGRSVDRADALALSFARGRPYGPRAWVIGARG